MPRFTLLRQGRVERSFELPVDDVVIGRLPGSTLELRSPSVSRQHARVHRDGARWLLEDLGSANGLWVGDHQVRWHELQPGDTFRIEEYAVLFEPDHQTFDSGLRAATERTLPGSHRPMTFMPVGAVVVPAHETA